MNKAVVLTLAGLVLSACGQRSDPVPAQADEKLNAETTVTESTSDRPDGRADGEEPEAGTNTGRPDSPRDLQPGTDGNTNPPQP
jgi:hypothetical protein